MADLTHYRFRKVWKVDAAPDAVFDVLADLATYPRWWPQVREVQRIDDHRAYVRIRATLPYTLRLRLHRRAEDRATGLLEVGIQGDLEGLARWRVGPGAAGSVLRYEQDVRTRKHSLNALAPVARWAFIANHAAMMRSGERGLRVFLGRGSLTPPGDTAG